MTGQTLAHYQILDKLGEGGMGAVYRARDTKLGRDVAVKVLLPVFAGDPDRMARFQREAQVLASLNHPNIAAIYGVEERALVMELVEGPTLAQRIAVGPVPLDEALPLAKQIADALEAAHDKGIIHRDLKPANVKVRPDGSVKVLDFGLAKALDDDPLASGVSNSPTMSLAATRAGVILGTAAYMSPEQAKGKPVDRRADIWAFGVVLMEMLTGRQMYSAETTPEILAAVMRDEPCWDSLPAGTPDAIRRLLGRCLDKDPKRRLQAIGEARLVLEKPQDVPDPRPPTSVPRPRLLPWAVAGVLGVVSVVSLAALWRATRAVEQPLMHFDVDLGADITPRRPGATVALSPDGTRLAYVVQDSDGKSRLYTRRLDQAQARPLSGTDGASSPFFSPDGQWVAFFADRKLKKISVDGGAAVTLCDITAGLASGNWGEDGSIIGLFFAGSGLSRVSSAGGKPELVTKRNPGDNTHRWPQILPGAKAVLFTGGPSSATYDDASIEVQSLETGQRKILQRGGSDGRYFPSGHLVWVHQGTLFAAPMDLRRLEITGPAVPVLEDVASSSQGGAQLSFSQTGTLVYGTGTTSELGTSLAWLDSTGKTQPLPAKPARYREPRLSPDGKRLALIVSDGSNQDLWVYDWERDTMTRLTFTPDREYNPVWTPDGRHIAFSSGNHIDWIRSDGSGGVQKLLDTKGRAFPDSFTPDGKRMAFSEVGEGTSPDIWTVLLEGDDPDHPRAGKPQEFLRTPFVEVSAMFSPGPAGAPRWLAYASTESGAMEVYVRPFGQGSGGKWQISNGGGYLPVWSRAAPELFYRTRDSRIMVAAYRVKGESFLADKPRLWSDKRLYTSRSSTYDLAPDGKRFVVLLGPDASEEQKPQTHVTFLLNFFDELRRRVPREKTP